MPRVLIAALSFCAVLGAGAGVSVHAESEWPTRPIHVIVPSPSGGQLETTLRAYADQLSQALGQPIVIEAKPGADGHIAANYVLHSKADGYTWMLNAVPFTVQAALYPDLGWHPARDFQEVFVYGSVRLVYCTPADNPATTLGEFAKYAQAHKGELSYPAAVRGSAVHLGTAIFNEVTGAEMVMVPYAGQPPAVTDLVGSRLQLMALSTVFAVPMVKAGRLKALAVMDDQRDPALPNVPTVVEAGYPQLALKSWFGIVVRKGTPQAIIDRINAEMNKIAAADTVKARLANMNVIPPAPNTPREAQYHLVSEVKRWTGVLQRTQVGERK